MASSTPQRATTPQVVIAYLDGRRVRGYVFDFSPTRDQCRIFPSATAPANEAEIVDFKTLKAIFFLQEPVGEAASANPPSAAPGRKIEVIFSDNERLEGSTQGYSRDRLGFFMVPEDPTRKIIRVFVINANVRSVRWL